MRHKRECVWWTWRQRYTEMQDPCRPTYNITGEGITHSDSVTLTHSPKGLRCAGQARGRLIYSSQTCEKSLSRRWEERTCQSLHHAQRQRCPWTAKASTKRHHDSERGVTGMDDAKHLTQTNGLSSVIQCEQNRGLLKRYLGTPTFCSTV